MSATENLALLPIPPIEDVAELESLLFADDQVSEYAREWKARDLWTFEESLLRFYLARKCNTQLAFGMLKHAMLWRISYRADRMLPHGSEDNKNLDRLWAYWPGRFMGADREGMPVWVERFGHVDPSSLLDTVPDEDLIHFHLWIQEMIGQALRRANDALPEEAQRKVCRHIAIMDLDSLGMKHYHSKGLDLLKQCIKLDESCYPERLSRLFVVNAPTVFRIIWAVVKPWLDPRTLAKISILGSDFTADLLAHIPHDQLPVAFGGGLDQPLPDNEGHFSDALPSGLFINPKKVKVGARGTHELRFTVDPAPQTLAWEFSTSDYDISMGLRREGASDFVLPVTRFDAHRSAIKGSVELVEPGEYVFIFDNTFSRFTGKSVQYHLTLSNPNAPPTPTSSSSSSSSSSS